ncbi:unnamed protein product [Ilex paraguariensis]|uniref:Uncharacterized protein n=1 Tax=Ilex paraguariensis TaxID=185542 RepID=A0ABC8UCQ4_9AQUA
MNFNCESIHAMKTYIYRKARLTSSTLISTGVLFFFVLSSKKLYKQRYRPILEYLTIHFEESRGAPIPASLTRHQQYNLPACVLGVTSVSVILLPLGRWYIDPVHEHSKNSKHWIPS